MGASLLSIKKAAIVEQMSISPIRASPSKQKQKELQAKGQPAQAGRAPASAPGEAEEAPKTAAAEPPPEVYLPGGE